jgi:hypothetical protein
MELRISGALRQFQQSDVNRIDRSLHWSMGGSAQAFGVGVDALIEGQ